MNVLIIGSGGREHALAWKVAQSPLISQVFVAPGNAGTALESKVVNVNIKASAIDELIHFAEENSIDLTLVGPEAPLVLGIVDQFAAQGLACLGPTQAAAQLESSKHFSKDFMREYNIPTADYAVFTTAEPAKDYLTRQNFPIVIKADGLAAGKGVIIAHNYETAAKAVDDMINKQCFDDAGHEIVIEEFLAGEEASFIVMCDGERALSLASSQDHKARDDGDRGPNTGGMGAYSPAPIVTPAIHNKVMREVIEPTLYGMKQRGTPYTGFLYVGLMIDKQGNIHVLEYNCRLGDPETQPLMMRLQSDLVELCQAALTQRLNQTQTHWCQETALGVVMANQGYPNDYPKGDVIRGLLEQQSKTKVFHAGTLQKDKQVVTNGGRVLCVVGLGNSVSEAQSTAYERVKTITWGHEFYRQDIGNKAL